MSSNLAASGSSVPSSGAQNIGDPQVINLLERHEYFIAGFVCIAATGLGITLEAVFKSNESIWLNKVIPFLILELGIAIGIALIVILTLERTTRAREAAATRRAVDDIKENLFKAVYGRSIPNSIFAEVERCLLLTNVVRSNYEVTYHLEHLNASEIGHDLKRKGHHFPDHILCKINSYYKLTNTTDMKIDQELCTFLELPPNPLLHEYICIEECYIGGVQQSQEAIKDCMSVNDDSDQAVHKTMVRLAPHESKIITTEMQIIKRNFDQEVWSSRLPSEGITLNVICPGDLFVGASASHSQKLVGPINTGTSHKWTMSHGIFPYQSIAFWWYPKSFKEPITSSGEESENVKNLTLKFDKRAP